MTRMIGGSWSKHEDDKSDDCHDDDEDADDGHDGAFDNTSIDPIQMFSRQGGKRQ